MPLQQATTARPLKRNLAWCPAVRRDRTGRTTKKCV